mmetsp:Transcript_42773/g.56489  ORF Transcript_42773/g.56489 Transcript_42773/m.56489 type:complete len:166 (+) Transcript_42773:360-857(+)|eukprot:CAMPEP_0170466510 /NCGR_PEP_ID=MMETSP0123-20130129/10443_1 /TAXON_ID=182087 /ORGANISM="Favella ehrenbergii, Strain Fehren 1" /LENGTH=165 /DNA_ID=CAMNT_0010732657 /DNA_START=321 /DNA_END=818 /DNA_ORIENTATION=+
MKHLETMDKMVEGETAVHFVKAARERFVQMCAKFTAYDYTVVRQQLYKLFADIHAPVSWLHRDHVQAADGTIILDMSGMGPSHSFRPGQVKFCGEGGERHKQIEIAHSEQWVAHPGEGRCEATTKPRLGENIYAEDRTALPVPWKPNVPVTSIERGEQSTENATA